MSDMFRDYIIELGKRPLNFKKIEDATVDYGDSNPTCGDEIHIFLKVDENNIITDVGFQGVGCTLSKASTSLLTDEIKGKSIEEVKKMTNDDVIEILGIQPSPARFKCAIIGLKVLEGAIVKLEGGEVGSSISFR